MIIYKITNLENGMIYIGQTVQSLDERRKGHIADSKRDRKKRPKSKISRAIAKYGIDVFSFEVIATAKSIEELNYCEQMLIAMHKSNVDGVGYNLLSGGSQNGNHSEETKAKISKSLKENPNRYWLGKKHSAESNKKRSDALRGVPCPSRGHHGSSNPLKNPEVVAKMLKTRFENKAKKLLTKETVTSV